MTTTITIKDQALGGGEGTSFSLEVLEERQTVREVIRARVYQEVQEHNARMAAHFEGLVRPKVEEQLNRPKEHRPIAFEPQFAAAIEAFEDNRLLVLVEDAQVDDLDQEFLVSSRTEVTFVKLIPLVGG